jgi:excisionase family DNA binding protein
MRAKELIDDPILEDELAEALGILVSQVLKRSHGKTKDGNGQAPDRLLSLKEAAERLGVSKSHVYHVAKDLDFMVKIGRRVMFSERGLEAHIKERLEKRI